MKVHRPVGSAAVFVFVAFVGKVISCVPAALAGDVRLRLHACITAAILCCFGDIDERSVNVAVRIYQDTTHDSPEGSWSGDGGCTHAILTGHRAVERGGGWYALMLWLLLVAPLGGTPAEGPGGESCTAVRVRP